METDKSGLERIGEWIFSRIIFVGESVRFVFCTKLRFWGVFLLGGIVAFGGLKLIFASINFLSELSCIGYYGLFFIFLIILCSYYWFYGVALGEREDLHRLGDAIDSYRKDCYGMTSFAHQFIKSLLEEKECIVGLTGPWGGGKTSLVNVMCSLLDERNHEDLKEHYAVDTSEFIGRMKIIYLSCFDIVSNGSIMSALFGKLAQTEGEIFGGSRELIECLPEVGGFSVRKFAVIIQNRLALQRRQRVQKSLKESSCERYIVIIDDVERISPRDAKKVVDELSFLYSLPKVTYLFPYDEIQLACAIGLAQGLKVRVECEAYGKEYLQKLIAYRRQLPMLPVDKVVEQKVEEVQQMCKESLKGKIEGGTKQYDVSDEVIKLLKRHLTTPRKVDIFFSALKYDSSHLFQELNLSDCLTVRILKEYWPSVYAYVKDHQSYFLEEDGLGTTVFERVALGTNWRQGAREQRKKQMLQAINDDSVASQWDEVEKLLDLLFQWEGLSQVRRYAMCRISTPSYFMSYFNFTLSSFVFTAEDRAQVFAALSDVPTFLAFLKKNLTTISEHFIAYFCGGMDKHIFEERHALLAVQCFSKLPEFARVIEKRHLIQACLNRIEFQSSTKRDTSF